MTRRRRKKIHPSSGHSGVSILSFVLVFTNGVQTMNQGLRCAVSFYEVSFIRIALAEWNLQLPTIGLATFEYEAPKLQASRALDYRGEWSGLVDIASGTRWGFVDGPQVVLSRNWVEWPEERQLAFT